MHWFACLLCVPLVASGLGGCFSSQEQPAEAETSRPFTKPSSSDFVGEYQLIDQQVVASLPLSLFTDSRLFLRNDSTYEFIKYPVFRVRDTLNYELLFIGLASYSGRWTIDRLGTAYDRDKGTRRDYWACSFSPVPGGQREVFNESLMIDPYVNKKTGIVQRIFLYYGDMDTGDYVLYERVTPASGAGSSNRRR